MTKFGSNGTDHILLNQYHHGRTNSTNAKHSTTT